MPKLRTLIAAIFVQLVLGNPASFAQGSLEQINEITNTTATQQNVTTDPAALRALLEAAGKNAKPTYYSLTNMFLEKSGKVLTLDSHNRLMMAADTRSDRQQWHLVQEGSSYRIYNKALGEGKAMDSDTQKPHMANKGNYSGQFWYFTAQGGWYRLSNSYQGINKVLDTYNATNNYVFFENKAKNTSGTYWKKIALSSATNQPLTSIP